MTDGDLAAKLKCKPSLVSRIRKRLINEGKLPDAPKRVKQTRGADELNEDNGLIDPIILYQEMILDGRNRHKACEQTMTEPRFEQFQGDDAAALAFVWSKNVHRRHLEPSQRAMAASKMASLKLGSNQHTAQKSLETSEKEGAQICARSPADSGKTDTIVSQAKAAEIAKVSARLVAMAKKLRGSGNKELIEKVERNETTLNAALKELQERRKARRSPRLSLRNQPWSNFARMPVRLG